MSQFAGDAYNPDACLAALPHQFSTAAAFVHKALEFWVLDDGLRDLRVVATVPVYVHVAVPQLVARLHYVELQSG